MSDDYWLQNPCDYCGAEPGEQCKTSSGGRASIHGGRTTGLSHEEMERLEGD